MRKMAYCLLMLAASIEPAVGQRQDYRKCLDSNGRIRYTDRPCHLTGGVEIGTKVPAVKPSAPAGNAETAKTEANPAPAAGKNQAVPTETPRKSLFGGFAEKLGSLFSFAKLSTGAQPADSPATPARPQFACQGKTRCTEMTSCEEAKFYLKNCPNVNLDGDKNGTPCKKQWCDK